MKPVTLGIIATLVIIVGGVFLLSKGSSSNPTTVNSPQFVKQGNSENQTATDFTAEKFNSSDKVTLSSVYSQKPVVLQFWATWCGICRAEFPANQSTIKKYSDKIDYIAIDWAQGDKDAVKNYISELGLDPKSINFVMDSDGSIGAAYGVRGTPVHVFIKKGGQISLIQTGGLSSTALEDEIQKIL